jgi:hypothetical protein
MRRGFLGGVALGVLLLAAALVAQPFSSEVTTALAQLTTGVTPFATVGLNAGSYLNWDVFRGASGYGIRDNGGTIQVKNLNGAWATIATSVGADPLATYLLQTTDAGLPNAQVLASLGSALLTNTTATGVLTAYTGTTCTNTFVRALTGLGVATCNAVTLTTDVTGTLPGANGGTGNAAYAVGDLLQGSGATTLARLADVAVGSYLRSGGVTTATLWSTLVLPNAATAGDLITATSANTLGSINASAATGVYLRGAGAVTPPIWSTVTLPNTATQGDVWYASAANTMTGLADVAVGAYLRSGGIATAPLWSTLILPNGATQGDVIVATGANTLGSVADAAVGSYLRSGGIATVPLWSTLTLLNAATANDIFYASAANTMGQFACATVGTVLIGGTPPSCSATANVTTYEVNNNIVAPPILLANAAAYAAITSTNAETYFAIGADGLIPAGALNAPKHRIALVLRGFYGTNGVTDAVTMKIKLCTVSGCGSGTVTTIGATAAILPGAAVASQGWEVREDVNVYTAGAPGTVDAQGFATYALTTLTAAQADDLVNTGTINIDTTVNEYVSVSATWNNNSASNTITLRSLGAYVY